MWNLRTFLAWFRNNPDTNILENYDHKINAIPLHEAVADFEKKFPDEDERLLLIDKVDNIVEMDKTWPLMNLETNDDIFTAQLEFMNIEGIQILPKARRFYPYGSVAAQTIGWVGPAQQDDRKLFENDKRLRYLDDEVSGRRPGVEYVCEHILRGKRGQIIHDIDRQLISRTPIQFGKDVSLTLDIELQNKIEKYLANCNLNPNCKAPTAAVVVDVTTADILALVSMPVFDLNRIRYDYDAFAGDPNEPLRNRAINKQYPPGSSVKPLILIAGLEDGKINPYETISCPAHKAPKGWPSCWVYNRYRIGHDGQWQNNAHNAIKGSCNIYFSQLANRIDPKTLQQWLFKFGYSRKILHLPNNIANAKRSRNLKQAQGQISHISTVKEISDFNTVPPLKISERRFFGIGQGNLRITPLQAANSMAVIARGGLYKSPQLSLDSGLSASDSQALSIELNISPETLDVIYDGMRAVVDEPGGTAYPQFAYANLSEQDVKVYGKTGSTEKPDNAWFTGFAKDSKGRGIAIAILVEEGQHGSSDAAPLARDIIQFCIDAGYIGQSSGTIEQEPDTTW